MKRWIHTSTTCNIDPQYLRDCALKFMQDAYLGPRGGTVSESIYYDQVSQHCRYIRMKCDEAIDSGDPVNIERIRGMIEGSIDTNKYLVEPQKVAASEAVLEWFNTLCDSYN